jgi:hypothetical protein
MHASKAFLSAGGWLALGAANKVAMGFAIYAAAAWD